MTIFMTIHYTYINSSNPTCELCYSINKHENI